MTITPGAHLKQRRNAAGLSLADVAARLSAVPRIAEHVRIEQLELIEADVQPATFSTIVALRGVFSFNIGILAALADIQLGNDRPVPQLCRICGCSEWDACATGQGTCSWRSVDLCSFCPGVDAEVAAAA